MILHIPSIESYILFIYFLFIYYEKTYEMALSQPYMGNIDTQVQTLILGIRVVT